MSNNMFFTSSSVSPIIYSPHVNFSNNRLTLPPISLPPLIHPYPPSSPSSRNIPIFSIKPPSYSPPILSISPVPPCSPCSPCSSPPIAASSLTHPRPMNPFCYILLRSKKSVNEKQRNSKISNLDRNYLAFSKKKRKARVFLPVPVEIVKKNEEKHEDQQKDLSRESTKTMLNLDSSNDSTKTIFRTF